ncbi:MAG: hypothetical protein Q4F31_07450 [Eubacteriales bacterium]|nr:hypothetical protein [Eubacteriales bacterium]
MEERKWKEHWKIKTTEGGLNAMCGAWKKDMDKAREEGLAEGLATGRKKLIETALVMLKDGLPIEKVSQYSGLSVSEIEKISLNNK